MISTLELVQKIFDGIDESVLAKVVAYSFEELPPHYENIRYYFHGEYALLTFIDLPRTMPVDEAVKEIAEELERKSV